MYRYKLLNFSLMNEIENCLRSVKGEYLVCDCVQGASTTYNPQTVYSIIPVTATHGSNVVYQQSAAASESVVHGDTSAFYYPSAYNYMSSSGVHHISAASTCPVPGILVQGPPPMQIYSASTHLQQETFHSGDGAACRKTDSVRSGCSQPPMQIYLPPAQRH